MRALIILLLPGLLLAQKIRVTDSQGRELAGARVEALGSKQIRISAPGFAPIIMLRETAPETVTLDPARAVTEITVTATPGVPEDAVARPEWITVASAPASPTIAHALENRPNVLLQQTGAGQVSPFLRGLTGYQVLNLVDGVRYNNSTFRSGPNQYLAYLEPSQAGRVEAMLGPSGTQYGSDGLGGTIQVLTEEPRFDASGWHGDAVVFGQTADLSAGANAHVARSWQRVWLRAGGAAQRHNNLRAGGGLDSHNVLTRLYGYTGEQVRERLGARLLDTAYSQAGGDAKLAFRRNERESLTFWYQRGEAHGLRNTKDLWGGLGRLQSTLNPQILDLFYVRYERLQWAGFDSVSGRFSVNRQQDGGRRQGLRATDAVTEEWGRVRSNGYSAQAMTHAGRHSLFTFGGELYDEGVRSSRLVNRVAVRPLYPDNSTYRIGGGYAQGATEYRRMRAGYGVRHTRVSFSNPAKAAFLTPASGQTFADWTGHGSLLFRLAEPLAIHVLAGRGFRAPNLNDLGAIGLNDLGYEVPSSEVSNALLSDSAGEAAVSKGVSLRALGVERVRNLEAGLRLQTRKQRARIQVFDALLQDPIVRRTLLFPANAAPAVIAGLAVTPIPQTAAQRAQGVVAVASAIDPRALKAFVNDGRSRYWGVETDWETKFSRRWTWSAAYSFLLGRDLDPNRNIRRLPPQQGSTRLRYVAGRVWAEGELNVAGAQDRLSGGDRDDERIGASRRRQDIADFYNAGRIQVSETLAQIQNRVLPGLADSARVTLFPNTPGWANVSLRAGLPIGEALAVEAALTNVADRNYRIHGSGIDAPGRSVHLQLRWLF